MKYEKNIYVQLRNMWQVSSALQIINKENIVGNYYLVPDETYLKHKRDRKTIIALSKIIIYDRDSKEKKVPDKFDIAIVSSCVDKELPKADRYIFIEDGTYDYNVAPTNNIDIRKASTLYLYNVDKYKDYGFYAKIAWLDKEITLAQLDKVFKLKNKLFRIPIYFTEPDEVVPDITLKDLEQIYPKGTVLGVKPHPRDNREYESSHFKLVLIDKFIPGQMFITAGARDRIYSNDTTTVRMFEKEDRG